MQLCCWVFNCSFVIVFAGNHSRYGDQGSVGSSYYSRDNSLEVDVGVETLKSSENCTVLATVWLHTTRINVHMILWDRIFLSCTIDLVTDVTISLTNGLHLWIKANYSWRSFYANVLRYIEWTVGWKRWICLKLFPTSVIAFGCALLSAVYVSFDRANAKRSSSCSNSSAKLSLLDTWPNISVLFVAGQAFPWTLRIDSRPPLKNIRRMSTWVQV